MRLDSYVRIVYGRWVEYLDLEYEVGSYEALCACESGSPVETCVYTGEEGRASPLRLAAVRSGGLREYSSIKYVELPEYLRALRAELESVEPGWCPMECEWRLLLRLYEWSGESWLGEAIGILAAGCL